MTEMSRRSFIKSSLGAAATYGLLNLTFTENAFAEPVRPIMEKWYRDLMIMCRDLRTNQIDPIVWQDRMEVLNTEVDLPALLKFIDFEKLTGDIDTNGPGVATRRVAFPRLSGAPTVKGIGSKIFALKKDGAVIPHAHNNMVSAHIVLQGEFHVRTYNRRFDLENESGRLFIEPARDSVFRRGDVLTMSDQRDNIHWLIAKSDHAYTFDIPVLDLFPNKRYPTQANRNSMIFIDPTLEKPEGNIIRAKVIGLDEALAKFGG